MKQIFVKLPNGCWIRVKGKLSGLSTTKSSKKTTYTLLAESIDKPEIPSDELSREFYILSTKVTKYIYKLLDSVESSSGDLVVVIEYVRPELYKVRAFNDSRDIVYNIALEMDIVKKTPTT